MQQVPRSMVVQGKKPAFFPPPMLAALTFVVLALGVQGGYISQSSAPPSTPAFQPTDVASLIFLTDSGLLDSGSYEVPDTVANITTFWGISTTVRFQSAPTTSFTIYGNYSFIRVGDSVLATFYYSEGSGQLYFNNLARN